MTTTDCIKRELGVEYHIPSNGVFGADCIQNYMTAFLRDINANPTDPKHRTFYAGVDLCIATTKRNEACKELDVALKNADHTLKGNKPVKAMHKKIEVMEQKCRKAGKDPQTDERCINAIEQMRSKQGCHEVAKQKLDVIKSQIKSIEDITGYTTAVDAVNLCRCQNTCKSQQGHIFEAKVLRRLTDATEATVNGNENARFVLLGNINLCGPLPPGIKGEIDAILLEVPQEGPPFVHAVWEIKSNPADVLPDLSKYIEAVKHMTEGIEITGTVLYSNYFKKEKEKNTFTCHLNSKSFNVDVEQIHTAPWLQYITTQPSPKGSILIPRRYFETLKAYVVQSIADSGKEHQA